jgi:hypothetical protein
MPKPKINKPAIVAMKPLLPPEETSPKPEAISNARGGTFGIGDKILVTAPWCVERVEAEIVGLYAEGKWAEYRFVVSPPEGWRVERGVIRCENLRVVE